MKPGLRGGKEKVALCVGAYFHFIYLTPPSVDSYIYKSFTAFRRLLRVILRISIKDIRNIDEDEMAEKGEVL